MAGDECDWKFSGEIQTRLENNFSNWITGILISSLIISLRKILN